jgi:hypothetical protein
MGLRACLLFALVSVAACGRIGVHLLPLDGSALERDASTRDGSTDIPDAEPGGGGQLSDNIPVALDAGTPRDASMDAAQDAATDASQDAGPSPAQDAAMDASQDAATDASQDAAVDAAQDAAADAAMDASQDAAMDASQDAAMDASQDAAMDSGVDASMPPCGGERVFGLCWYLATTATNCNQACSSKGGFDTRAVDYVGTPAQGGSVEECTQILTALGQPGSVTTAMRTDSYGLGCHLWTDGTTRFWLIDPPFTPSKTIPSGTPVRIACACTR